MFFFYRTPIRKFTFPDGDTLMINGNVAFIFLIALFAPVVLLACSGILIFLVLYYSYKGIESQAIKLGSYLGF